MQLEAALQQSEREEDRRHSASSIPNSVQETMVAGEHKTKSVSEVRAPNSESRGGWHCGVC